MTITKTSVLGDSAVNRKRRILAAQCPMSFSLSCQTVVVLRNQRKCVLDETRQAKARRTLRAESFHLHHNESQIVVQRRARAPLLHALNDCITDRVYRK
jgi:hypothetical protein